MFISVDQIVSVMVLVTKDLVGLNLGKDSYEIVVGSNLFERAASELAERKFGFKHAIITDTNVRPLYAERLARFMKDAGIETHVFDFPAGEENKKMSTVDSLADKMDSAGFGRDSVVVGVGGGVVTDLSGLLASLYARGIPCVLYPTSTAAQADAAIGGKTGVNTSKAKNRLGKIQQPKRIYNDVATLDTLSDRSYREGIAEWVKHGIIRNAHFFGFLECYYDKILEKNKEKLVYAAIENARIKGEVVESDPEEKDLRQILNYGHTIGHVLEQKSRYSLLMHGEAVSIGMQVEARIAIEMGHFSKEELERQEALLRKFGLPTKIPKDIPIDDIVGATVLDKKARQGVARYAIPERIGKMWEFEGKYAGIVDNETVLKALKETQ